MGAEIDVLQALRSGDPAVAIWVSQPGHQGGLPCASAVATQYAVTVAATCRIFSHVVGAISVAHIDDPGPQMGIGGTSTTGCRGR